jgi:hypothetical protein
LLQIDPSFTDFADLCEALTAQFWQQHYPGGDLTEVGADYDQLRQQAGQMAALIVTEIPPANKT